MIIVLYKNEGETPLQAIERLKKERPAYVAERFTYAGRLDPMASGILLLLSGGDILKKDEVLSYDKTYVVEILFGFKTDTGDILGIAEKGEMIEIEENKLKEVFESCVGTFEEKYPPYSSKPVKGKPLFSLARSGELTDEELPTHTVTIKEIKLDSISQISGEELLSQIQNRMAKVSGDFRQEACFKKWKEILNKQEKSTFMLTKIEVTAASGAYMRVLAEKIGEKLGMFSLAYTIVRTRVGEYTKENLL